ncbi:MAG: SURF1 family protein [Gammaproteobacteria bacterium]
MRIASWEFSPSLWPTLATLLVLPLFISLGFWQLDRAEQKRTLHHEFETRQAASEINLNKEDALRKKFDELQWRKVSIEGAFSRDNNVLLDNQVERGVAGYFIYTPFKLKEQDAWVLVNRGWVPAGTSRDNPPGIVAAGEVLRIFGSVKPPPKTGILLAQNVVERVGGGMVRVQKLELAGIEKALNLELLPYVVRMDPESSAGFTRSWKVPGSGEEKHLGYAFQWFAMATAIFVIYLVLNIKRAK